MVVYKNLIITSCDSRGNIRDFFGSVKTLIASLHDICFDSYDMMFVYDLGLSLENRKDFERMEKVKVIDYPREAYYPEFLDRRYYGFKIFSENHAAKFSENVLWLDAGICVLSDISVIFDIIDRDHIFLVEDKSQINRRWTSPKCVSAMCATDEELSGFHLIAGVLGYKVGGNYQFFIDEAFRYAKIRDCLVGDRENHRWDQSIYSILRVRYNVPVNPGELFGQCSTSKSINGEVLYVHRASHKWDYSKIRYKES